MEKVTRLKVRPACGVRMTNETRIPDLTQPIVGQAPMIVPLDFHGIEPLGSTHAGG